MKNLLFTLLFTLSSTYMYSQEVNFGLSLGTGLSNQTLQSSNSPYTAGQTWNTIGGLPYRVDPYLGYNAGVHCTQQTISCSSKPSCSSIHLNQLCSVSSNTIANDKYVNNIQFWWFYKKCQT